MDKIFSVIIVAYKNISIIRDCLNSIFKYNDIGQDLEVIVSDNSPDMCLFNKIHNEFPQITMIKNENNGFGAGNNRGFEVSKGKYLLFLNPDTILVEPIFCFAVSKFEANENLALFGLQLVDKNLKKTSSFYMMDREGIWSLFQNRWYCYRNKYIENKMFIAGADLFVRRSAFEEAGRFDENIFMYKEEPDLIKRIKCKSGAKQIAYFKDKHIIHLEGGTEADDDKHSVRFAQRLSLVDKYYCKKHGLNYEKVIRQKMRRAKFKLAIYTVICKKKKIKEQKEIYNIYRNALSNN